MEEVSKRQRELLEVPKVKLYEGKRCAGKLESYKAQKRPPSGNVLEEM
ncbi:hypothetical protein LCGC14_0827080 [marine sediment metagenome]|uniref:Uncharacterized protein n=1 Tax=marine sediment metagenome TaxID=412755 RepID=A0A0F9PLT0_9ZZZZ